MTNALAANWIFQTNNFIDSDTNGILNGANTQWGMFTNQYTQFSRPFPLVRCRPTRRSSRMRRCWILPA